MRAFTLLLTLAIALVTEVMSRKAHMIIKEKKIINVRPKRHNSKIDAIISQTQRNCLEDYLETMQVMGQLDQVSGVYATTIGSKNIYEHNKGLLDTVDRIRFGTGSFSNLYAQFASSSVMMSRKRIVQKRKPVKKLRVTYRNTKFQKRDAENDLRKQLENPQSRLKMFQELQSDALGMYNLTNMYGANYEALVEAAQKAYSAVTEDSKYLPGLNMPIQKIVTKNPRFRFGPLWTAEGAQDIVKHWQSTAPKNVEDMSYEFTCSKHVGKSHNQTMDGYHNSSVSIKIPLLFSSDSKTSETYKVDTLVGTNLRVDISWGGLKVINVYPGRYVLPQWEQVSSVDKRKLQGVERMTNSQMIQNYLVDKYFGAHGPLRYRIKQLILGFRPVYTFTLTNSNANEFQKRNERDGKVCLGPLCGKPSKGNNVNDKLVEFRSDGVVFTDMTSTPVLVGVIWDEYE